MGTNWPDLWTVRSNLSHGSVGDIWTISQRKRFQLWTILHNSVNTGVFNLKEKFRNTVQNIYQMKRKVYKSLAKLKKSF